MENKQILNFDKTTFRASSWGSLMSEPKGKSNKDKYEEVKLALEENEKKINETKPELKTYQKLLDKRIELKAKQKELEPIKDEINLSVTCMTTLLMIYIEKKYGRRFDLKNKYVGKGKAVEQQSINILNEVDDAFYVKNKERKYDEFFEGENDIDNEIEDEIIDIKSSWDLQTFIKKTIEDVLDDYEKQGQVYMELWDREYYRVANVLVDTPEGLIKDECRRLLYEIGTDQEGTDEYEMMCNEIRRNLTYTDIPVQERVWPQLFKRDREMIERMKIRAVECRNWLNAYAIKMHNMAYGDVINELKAALREIKEKIVLIPEAEIEKESITIVSENESLGKSEELKSIEPEIIQEKELVGTETVMDDVTREETLGEVVAESEKLIIVEKTELIEQKITIPESIEIPAPPAQTPQPAIEENASFETIKAELDACKDKDDVRKVYQKYTKEYNGNPEVKKALVDKRDSFDEVVAPVSAPPPVTNISPQPTKPPAPVAAPAPATSPKPTKTIKKDIKGDAELIVEIKDATVKCKTSAAVMEVYEKYKEFLDKPDNEQIKLFVGRKGTELKKEEAKPKEINSNDL